LARESYLAPNSASLLAFSVYLSAKTGSSIDKSLLFLATVASSLSTFLSKESKSALQASATTPCLASLSSF